MLVHLYLWEFKSSTSHGSHISNHNSIVYKSSLLLSTSSHLINHLAAVSTQLFPEWKRPNGRRGRMPNAPEDRAQGMAAQRHAVVSGYSDTGHLDKPCTLIATATREKCHKNRRVYRAKVPFLIKDCRLKRLL